MIIIVMMLIVIISVTMTTSCSYSSIFIAANHLLSIHYSVHQPRIVLKKSC